MHRELVSAAVLQFKQGPDFLPQQAAVGLPILADGEYDLDFQLDSARIVSNQVQLLSTQYTQIVAQSVQQDIDLSRLNGELDRLESTVARLDSTQRKEERRALKEHAAEAMRYQLERNSTDRDATGWLLQVAWEGWWLEGAGGRPAPGAVQAIRNIQSSGSETRELIATARRAIYQHDLASTASRDATRLEQLRIANLEVNARLNDEAHRVTMMRSQIQQIEAEIKKRTDFFLASAFGIEAQKVRIEGIFCERVRTLIGIYGSLSRSCQFRHSNVPGLPSSAPQSLTPEALLDYLASIQNSIDRISDLHRESQRRSTSIRIASKVDLVNDQGVLNLEELLAEHSVDSRRATIRQLRVLGDVIACKVLKANYRAGGSYIEFALGLNELNSEDRSNMQSSGRYLRGVPVGTLGFHSITADLSQVEVECDVDLPAEGH